MLHYWHWWTLMNGKTVTGLAQEALFNAHSTPESQSEVWCRCLEQLSSSWSFSWTEAPLSDQLVVSGRQTDASMEGFAASLWLSGANTTLFHLQPWLHRCQPFSSAAGEQEQGKRLLLSAAGRDGGVCGCTGHGTLSIINRAVNACTDIPHLHLYKVMFQVRICFSQTDNLLTLILFVLASLSDHDSAELIRHLLPSTLIYQQPFGSVPLF